MKHIVIIKIILLFFYALISLNLYSQENNRRFERLTDGLDVTNNHISKILQDKQGYLWLTSRDGLLKYDGYTVTRYQYKPFDPHSVPQNVIYTLFIDQTDTMWLGTPEGLTIFERKFERFTRLTTSLLPGMPDLGNVSAINEDGMGNLWIGNYEGKLWRYNRKDRKFLSLTSKLGFKNKIDSLSDLHEVIFKIYKDEKDIIWIGTSAGLHRLNTNSEKFVDISFTRFQNDPSNAYSLKSNSVADLHEDCQGVLWISTSSPQGTSSLPGLSQFDPATEKFTFFPTFSYDSSLKNSNEAWWAGEILEDSSGTLWIADRYSLRSFNKERTDFTYWFKRENNTGARATRIYALGLDVGGNLFVSTSNGLQSLILNQKAFGLLHHESTDNNSISSNDVLALAEDKSGNIWVGTNNGGLNKWDKASGTITRYQYDAKNADSLKRNNVAGIIEDVNEDLWICNGEFLSSLKKGSQTFEHFNIKLKNSEKTEILSVCQDRDGMIWLGTANGIKSFNRISKEFKHYFHKEGDSLGISDYTAVSIFADSRGNIWVGTGSKAFNKFNKAKGTFTHYKNNTLDTSSISSNIIQSVFEDSKGKLWIGTNGGGLCQYNYSDNNFITHTRNKDLPWSTVYSILEDNMGNLWLGTEKGLSCYLIAEKEFINYDVKDGLQSNLFAAGSTLKGSGCKGKDGILYFGGDNGLNYFDPEQIRHNRYKPPVVITKFKIFDKLQPGKNEAKEIVLNYNQNFFSFEFAALNYTNAQKNKYAYQLEGFDPDWIVSGSRRYASYTNLDPGEYTFKVRGSNNDGIWNEKGISVKLIIRPPWWKTWWAYALYGLLFIAGVLLVHRYQKQRVIQAEREKARYEKELLALEAKSLRAQMNPHFVFNCLNSIKALMQENQNEKGVTYLTTFSKLIRTLFNNADRKEISLYDEIETCKFYLQLEVMRFDNRLSYSVEVNENIDLKSVQVPALIIQPFIENAVWHGIVPRGSGTVGLSVLNENGDIQVIIEDDGIGREASQQNKSASGLTTHQSKGVTLTYSRLKLDNLLRQRRASIETIDKKDESGKASGTKVIITINEET
jgi:ligand-binding sensor domain-containing protein